MKENKKKLFRLLIENRCIDKPPITERYEYE